MMRLLTVVSIVAVGLATAPQPCSQFSKSPVPFSQLPSYFSAPRNTHVESLLEIETIRQTLSQYVYIIDGRAFGSLPEVFTTDAIANYSAPIGIMNGVETIEATLSAALAQFLGTQHLIGSQNIRLCGTDSAISATYFRAAHFLQRNVTGGAQGVVDDSSILFAYAQYQDSWVKCDGLWKIKARNLVYMGPLVTDYN